MSTPTWPDTSDLEPWSNQQARLPAEGRHILASFDDDSIIVYQAYKPEIGRWAVEHGRLDGPQFRLERFSWIKTSFLWMMHRSDWGRKDGQTVVLAIRLARAGFEAILGHAVAATAELAPHLDGPGWKRALGATPVQLNWDPDYDPQDQRLVRRAIQLGLRGDVLRRFASEWIVGIEDISVFVVEAAARRGDPELALPRHEVYPVVDAALAARLSLSG